MKRGVRNGALVLVAAAYLAAGAAGCNFIVGVGDYAVGDAEVADGPGADATQGDEALSLTDVHTELAVDTGTGADVRDASPDRGDVTADAPRSDATADADARSPGIDAEAGNPLADASDAGTGDGSDGGPPTGCGATSFPTTAAFNSLVASCVYVSSCDPFIVPLSLSECITNDRLHAPSGSNAISCLANITDCNGYYACESTRVSTYSECPTFDGMCTPDNVAINCNFDPTAAPFIYGTVTNCAAIPGGSCLQYTSGSAIVADCVVQSGCTVGAGTPECLGNSLSVGGCQASPLGGANVALGRSCGNATCTTASSGSCTFLDTGLCASEISSTCSGGSVVQTCAQPAQTFTYACGKAGETCQQVTANLAECLSPGCPATQVCTESCDGFSTITACVGGAPFTIDCTAYGFSGCATTSSTTNPIAYCTPY